MTTITQPLVSIVIPVYNAEPFIGATMASIVNQTYKNLEVLVIDDCSKDRSVEVIEGFKDSRIKVMRNATNLGPAGNWNKALREATGKYVKLVCCDDLLAPECIERQVAVLENPENQDVGLVGCARRIVNTNGREIMVRGYPNGSYGKLNGRDVIKLLVRWGANPIGEPVSGLFRRDLALKVGEYRASAAYVIDLDYWVRLLSLSNLYFIKEPLCSFRISTKSWSARLGLTQFRDFNRFIRVVASEQANLISREDLVSGTVRSAVNTVARVMIFKLFA